MSQRRGNMLVVANESGAGDRLVRPLCAKNLPETLPERKGWINRAQLYDFTGRSRKPQIALAAKFGFKEYAQPAGGCCFLIDKRYSKKLVDLWCHRKRRDYDVDDIILLKVGWHLRPRFNFKLIIAREEGETNFLEGYKRRYPHIRPTSHRGALTLIDGDADNSDLYLSARVAARFSQGRGAEAVEVEVTDKHGVSSLMSVPPLASGEISKRWYL